MTIVADSSALMAVLLHEPDFAVYVDLLDESRVLISAATLTEAMIVAESRLGDAGLDALRTLVELTVDEIVPLDANHARAAHTAWRRFGKGRHPARLSFGDCLAYATARLAGAPLLFKGDDFAQTDVASAT